MVRKSPLKLWTRVRAHLLSIIFFSFPSAMWPNGFVLFFFLVWAESRKATKLDPGCFGTIGCSKIIGGEKNNGSRGIKEKKKRVWSKLWFEHDIKSMTIFIFIL